MKYRATLCIEHDIWIAAKKHFEQQVGTSVSLFVENKLLEELGKDSKKSLPNSSCDEELKR